MHFTYRNWLERDHNFCTSLDGVHVRRGMLGIPLKDHEPKTVQAEHSRHKSKLPKRLGLSTTPMAVFRADAPRQTQPGFPVSNHT
jgi:hypothetical protein